MASAEQKPMRGPTYLIPPLLLTAGLFTGCLQVEQAVTIAPDGSGTQSMELTVPDRVLHMLQQQATARNPVRRTPDLMAVFDRKKVEKELVESGLKLTSHKVSEVRNGRRATLVAKFQSLEQLRKSSVGGGRADWIFKEGPVKGSIHLAYYPRGRAAWVQARQKAAELRKKPNDPLVRSFFEKRKAQLEGLDLSMTINLPGTVLMCYGEVRETGLKQAQVRVTGSGIKTPVDLVLALAPRYEVVFDGRGCTFAVERSKRKK